MKTLIVLMLLANTTYAGPTKVGNGDEGADLEGFDLVTEGKLVETKKKAIDHLLKLNTPGVPGLGNLLPEVENEKIYLTKKDIDSKKLEELGAFHTGMEGLVFARTFARPYSPTRYFPASLKLDENQLMALHIHEALHRSLPDNVRTDEKIVSSITLALISPDQSTDGLRAAVREQIPDLFIEKQQVAIDKNSRLQVASALSVSYSHWAKSKRGFFNNVELPIKDALNLDAEFYPIGSKDSVTGLGVKTSYYYTKNKNFMGPVELALKHLIWSQRNYDLEFKAGKLIPGSDAKMINSAFGRDSWFAGAAVSKISDRYKLRLGLDYYTSSNYVRYNTNKTVTDTDDFFLDYKAGALLDINGSASIPFEEFEVGLTANIYSLSSLDVVNESTATSLLKKGSDQYFATGPFVKYKLKKDITAFMNGHYVFNSNKDVQEDYVGDLFETGMGQWKISLGVSMLFE